MWYEGDVQGRIGGVGCQGVLGTVRQTTMESADVRH